MADGHPATRTVIDTDNDVDRRSQNSSTSTAVDSIPSGSVVLAYPYPDYATNTPISLFLRPIDSVMLDQAVSGMRFDLIGGFGWFPSPTGSRGTSFPAGLTPGSVQALFDRSLYGLSPPKSDMNTDIRAFLQKYHVEAVLLAPPRHLRLGAAQIHQNSAGLISSLDAVIGRPKDSDGVNVWLRVWQRLDVRTA